MKETGGQIDKKKDYVMENKRKRRREKTERNEEKEEREGQSKASAMMRASTSSHKRQIANLILALINTRKTLRR